MCRSTKGNKFIQRNFPSNNTKVDTFCQYNVLVSVSNEFDVIVVVRAFLLRMLKGKNGKF